MIRYLDLTNQINEGEYSFAFFDTVINQILSFDGVEVFNSKEDFIDYFKSDKTVGRDIDRFLNLIPEKSSNEILILSILPEGITLKDLKEIRNYFGENDVSMFEHKAFSILDSLIKNINKKENV